MKVLYFTRDYTPHDFRFLNAIIENGDDVWYLRLETRNVYESRPLPEKEFLKRVDLLSAEHEEKQENRPRHKEENQLRHY